jgi:hypothetical protein
VRNIALAAVALAAGAAFAAYQETPKRAPEIDGGHGWINTDKPVTIASLKGKIVLLDFWTYC